MTRRIRFTFERGGELVAELAPDVAPQTVRSLLALLPLTGPIYHTRWCGREIYLPIESGVEIPRENLTVHTNTGDVTYWREWDRVGPRIAEAISIFYGAEVVRDHRGYLPVNVFARVPQGEWRTIEEIGLRVWQRGIEQVTISAMEES